MAAESVRENGRTVSADGGEVSIRIPITRGQIERSYRDGDDLVVVVAGGETLRVKGFFAADDANEAILVLEAAGRDGHFEAVEVSSEGRILGTVEVALGQLEEMFGGRSSGSEAESPDGDGTFAPERAMGLSPMAVGAPLGLLLAGAVASGGGGGDDSPEPSQQPLPASPPSYPPSSTSAPEVQPTTLAPPQAQEQAQPQVEPAPPAAQKIQPAETPQTQRSTALQSQTLQGPDEVEIDTDGVGRFEHDDNGDGTVDRIVERIDADRDGFFESVTTETFVNGTRDSRTFEQDIDDDGDFDQRDVYRYNDKGQQVRLERDHHADGILDNITRHSYHANGTLESAEYDLQADGVFERSVSFSPAGRKVREVVDDNNDGSMDRIDVWSHHANGTVERHDTDYENDGTVDKSVSYDSIGRKVRREHDPEGDGTKETTAWSYHASGRVVARERVDGESDGNFERVSADVDADGRWDWIGHDPNDDGELDRVEVVDGDAFASGLGAGQAAEFAGVGTVDLAGGGGSAVLTLTDGDLTELASGASDYVLTIDGGSGDTVRFADSGIYATDATSTDETGNEYREHRGTSGRILVDSDIGVTGAVEVVEEPDPLAALLANLATATVEMFERAGITGITSDNLAAVKTVFGAYGDAVSSLTLAQLQNLAGVATDGIAVPAGGTIDGASLVQEGLALDINTNADASIEQRAVVSLDSATLAPTGVSRSVDTDGDGTLDDKEKTDSNYDGTQDRTVARFDADDDGTYQKVVRKTYTDGTLDTEVIERDKNDNGTNESVETILYVEGTLDSSTELRDFNEDGTSESVLSAAYADGTLDTLTVEWDSDADGTNERTLSVTYDDGTRDAAVIELDANDNGTNERTATVQFVDGTLNSRTVMWDYDENGTSESIVRIAYVDGMKDTKTIEWDYNGDGSYERVKTVEFVNEMPGIRTIEWDLDSNGSTERLAVATSSDGTRQSRVVKWDDNGDGTYENVVTIGFVEGTISTQTNNFDSDDDGTSDSVIETTFSYGVENTRTDRWDNDSDGTWDRVAVRTDADRDGTYETLEVEAFDNGAMVSRTVKRNVDDEGRFDWKQISKFNAEGEMYRRKTDSNNDGTLDKIETFRNLPIPDGGSKLRIRTYDGADGTLDTEEFKYDFDSNGSFDSSELFEFNASGQQVRYTSDSNDDGTPERIHTYQYEQLAGGGRVKVSRIDADADGTVDSVERNYYVGSGIHPDYVVYDISGGPSGRADGTADRLEYRDGLSLEHTIDGSDAGLAGVHDITLSRHGGATTLTLTDSGLAGLAAGVATYALVIDGDDDDMVRFDGGSIQATGQRVGLHDVYQHSLGRILIDSDIEVAGAVESGGEADQLAALLANLAAATVEMFERAGVTGVNDGNLDDVKLVIVACGVRVASLTLGQVQNLADIVSAGIAVRPEEDLLVAAVDAGSMMLDLSVDADAEIEQREKSVALDLEPSSLAPTSLVRTFILDNHYWDQRIEKDRDYDGTIDSVAWVDIDPDSGNFRKVITDEFVDGVRELRITEESSGSDGELVTREVTRYNDDGSPTLYEQYNHMGVIDYVRSYEYNDGGTLEIMEFDINNDGADRRNLFNPSARMTSHERYVSGELVMRDTFAYHDSGTIWETDEHGHGGEHTLPDGTAEIIRHFDLNGRRVLLEQDSDYDGTVDRKDTWSYYRDNLVERHTSDVDGNGTVDQILNYGRNESGEEIYQLLDDNADGTWDILRYNGHHPHQQALDADLAGQMSGIARVEMQELSRGTTLTITDEALSALAGSAEDYAVVILGNGSQHTVDLRSGNIERITGDGAVDADGRLGYQGTDGKLYIDPDIMVLV